MNFILVKVDQDYDYVSGVDYVARFATYEEAIEFLSIKKKSTQDAWLERIKYIRDFVDLIDIPKMEYIDWLQFLKDKTPFGVRYVYPKDFHNELNQFLMHFYASVEHIDIFNGKNYNPPPVPLSWDNVFVVEIKDGN